METEAEKRLKSIKSIRLKKLPKMMKRSHTKELLEIISKQQDSLFQSLEQLLKPAGFP